MTNTTKTNKPRSLLLLLAMAAAAACSSDSTGTAHLTWDLVQGGVDVSCARGDYVETTSTRGGSTDVVDQFDCSAMDGDIVLPTGTWSISVALFDVGNHQLSEDAAVQAVIASGRVTEIGNFEFSF